MPTPAGLAFTPDGALLAIADRRRILVVDRSGELRHVLEPHASTVEALAYAADGRTLAVAAYGGLRLWSIEAGEPAAKDLAWKGSLLQTAWRPNATVIASGTQDGAVHFWRLDRGSDAAMHGFPAKPKAIVWDSRGRVLATSGGGLVCTWDFTTGPEGQRPTILSGHDDVPCDVMAFKPLEATLAGGTRAGRVLLWSPLRSPEPLAGAEVGAEVTALAWSPSELLIVTTRTGTVVAYELSR
ncbi:MAG: WD40 repeat domain-containing protein [Myxococcales bacterium]|nr:WD40 repeat domain-containing protein [Myxococcales bacterium]